MFVFFTKEEAVCTHLGPGTISDPRAKLKNDASFYDFISLYSTAVTILCATIKH